MISRKAIMDKLYEVPDPELGISIVDLGLVYDVTFDKKGKVEVLMTLTTMGCPLFDSIREPIEHKVSSLKGVKDVIVNLTFEPPWDVSKMSDDAKVKMGFF